MIFIQKCIFTICLFNFGILNASYIEKRYNVHTLEGPTKIERTASGILDINCYIGKPKTIANVFKTVKFILEIPSESYFRYEGATAEEVWKTYAEDSSLWSGNFFSQRKSRLQWLNPYNNTCIAIKTDERYTVQLDIQNVDYRKVSILVIGVILFIYSRSLGENVVFFYLSGISLGVFASFMILVYFLSKMLPGKPIVYGAMIGGWTLGVYALQMLWSNFQPLLLAYHTYVMWYILTSGFISFIICYKLGPPKDQRNKNLITWTLQAVGIVLIYFSTEMTEAFAAIVMTLVVMKLIPRSWINAVLKYWRLKHPPKRVLLTQEEYYKQGQQETAKALEELRGYCSSPDCPQWKLMLKLKNPQKFANFVETEVHLSDDEIADYETSEPVIRRRNISNHKYKKIAPVISVKDDLTTDDSSLSSDDLL